jgi:hypothetical protein
MSIPTATFEGDNTVLLQQTSKFLLFKLNLDKDFAQLRRTFSSSSREDAIAALEYAVVQQLRGVKERIEALGDQQVPFKTIWNEKEQVALVRASEIWGFMTLLQLLEQGLQKVDQHPAFFRKVAHNFTHSLLRRVPELEAEGFKVQWTEPWK